MKIIPSSDTRAVARLLDQHRTSDPALRRRVVGIVERVRLHGDRALREFARRFDGLRGPLEIPADEVRRLARDTPGATREAIATAARHIRRVARRQKPRGWTVTVAPGVRIEQRVIPLETVGCYVPGGRYPLPSSLLMAAVPARVAGVRQVVVVCPRPDPVVMAAALEAGVDRVFRIGGAHAIAALAYGTETVPRVDKVVGPGNAYVATAKDLVAADCGIDFRAGPTEIVILSSRGNPAWIAADLLAQAEHDPDARPILITPSRRLADRVVQELARQTPASGPARTALDRNGGAVVTRSLGEAIGLANRVAAEHVVCDADAVADRITNAGAIFVGGHTAQAAGDYATGSNHVLPTGGAARQRGGLHAADFVKIVSVQRLTSAGLRRLSRTVITLAEAEGLGAHAQSIRVRLS